MPRGRTKRTTKKQTSLREKDSQDNHLNDHQVQHEFHSFSKSEVEHRIAAIQAIRDAETQDLLTYLDLLRSVLGKEHLETCALVFFKENLPNIFLVRNIDDGILELEWKNRADNNPGSWNERNTPMSCSNSLVPDMSSFNFSGKSVEAGFIRAASLHIPDFILEEMPETQVLAPHGLQTPGASSQRSSIGLTPRTQRHPKNGEILLSVHGSPLGFYKEENMETIQEAGEN